MARQAREAANTAEMIAVDGNLAAKAIAQTKDLQERLRRVPLAGRLSHGQMQIFCGVLELGSEQ